MRFAGSGALSLVLMIFLLFLASSLRAETNLWGQLQNPGQISGVTPAPPLRPADLAITCKKTVADQLDFAKKNLISTFIPQEDLPQGYDISEVRLFCQNGALLWGVGNSAPHVLAYQSPHCSCLHRRPLVTPGNYGQDSCLETRFQILAEDPAFAPIESQEKEMKCHQGDLVWVSTDKAGGQDKVRLLEEGSPFCQCPQRACGADLSACTASEFCQGGICRPAKPSCDRDCIQGRRKALEREIEDQIASCKAGTCQRREIYVSPQGDDTSGDGSSTQPFQNPARALKNLSGPTTVHLAAGTYEIDPIYLQKVDVELLGAGTKQTLLRAKQNPDYNQNNTRLLLAEDSRVVLKDLSVDSRYQISGTNSLSGYKIPFAFNFYNSRVELENLSLNEFDSNQFFGMFNTAFRISGIKIGDTRRTFNGDLVFQFINAWGILENSQVTSYSDTGAKMDHIISTTTLPLSGTTNYVDPKKFKATPKNRLIIRDNILIGRDTAYGDGMRLSTANGAEGQEYYIYNNQVTKAEGWEKDPNGACWGIRVDVTPGSILELRNNRVSQFCTGVSLHGDPLGWNGVMLFEGNQVFDNSDIGIEIGSSPSLQYFDFGKNPFEFLDFGGGPMASKGGNAFYGNGQNVVYRLNTDLYLRENYWGPQGFQDFMVQKDVSQARVFTTPERNKIGDLIYELKDPPLSPMMPAGGTASGSNSTLEWTR